MMKSEKSRYDSRRIRGIDHNEVGILYPISRCGNANKPIMWNAVQSNSEKKSYEKKVKKLCLIVHLKARM